MKKTKVNLTIEIDTNELIENMNIQGEELNMQDVYWWQDQLPEILEVCDSKKIFIKSIKTLDKQIKI